LIVAVASALISCYPVVFFGKSFVSPNILGSAMLYQTPPFLPGYKSTALEFPKGSDTGAMLWQNLPYSFIQSRALLRDHELPLWNRYNAGGTPLLAQGLSMFGDPLHTIVVAAGGAAWAWDLKFILAKALFCLALGLLVFRSAAHLPSALILTASSAFLGFFSYRFDHPAFFSMCYAPWLLLSWLEISKATTSRGFAGWAGALLLASWAELNSGGVKEGYMLLLSLHGCGLLVFALTAQGLRLRKLIYLCALGIAFLLLSAPIWMPFIDTLKNSMTAYDNPPSWQIQPGLILGLFDEIFYRSLNAEGEVFNPSANFLVLLGCLSALACFQSLLRNRTFVAIALGAMPPLALIFGIVPSAVISKIPVLRNVSHIDNTFSCVLIIEAIVVAGFGLKCLFARGARRGWSRDYLVITLAFLGLLGLYLGFTHARQRSPDEFIPPGQLIVPNAFFYVYCASVIAAFFLLPVLVRLAFRRPRTLGLVIPLAAICFVALHWRFGMHLQTHVTQIDDAVVNPQVRVDLEAHSRAIDFIKDRPDPSRTVGVGNTFFAGYNGISGLESITGSDPLQNIYFRDLVVSARIPLVWIWRWVVEKQNLNEMLPILNILNVRYFLDDRNAADMHHPGFSKIADLDLKVYENTSAWPRAFYVDSAITYDSIDQFLGMTRNGGGGPFAAIERKDALASPVTLPTAGTLGNQQTMPARNYQFTNNTTTFSIDAPGAGIAVLAETYVPDDFIVRLNGARTYYFRVNQAFRGVWIPKAGTYRISYSYWPRRFTISLLMAAGGVLIIAAAAVTLLRSPRGAVGPSSPAVS
jgi:hypothetical protein